MNASGHSGGCLCGGVRYLITAPLQDIAHCHCSMCRRHGGIVTTWVTVPREAFAWTSGQAKPYRSSASTTRYFCPGCGALLALATERAPTTVDVTVATLDHPEQHPANRHIWFGDRLSWLSLDEELPHEHTENY